MTRRAFVLPLVLSLSAATSFAAPQQAPLRRPTLVTGSVEDQAFAGIVKVGKDGAEWALPGGSSLTASAGSELRVLGVPQELDLGGKKKVPGYTVVLKSGLVRARVPANATSVILVAAPKKTSVLVASGDTSVIAGERLAVANAVGKTSVGVAGKPLRTLEAGMLQVLDDAGSTRRPLLASPSTLKGSSVVLASGEQVDVPELSWNAIEGAATYRVELRERGSDRLKSRVETREPRLVAGSLQLRPGSYFVRVVSIDSVGLESAAPLVRPLQVVGVELPVGSYREESGALRLPAGARIGLSHVEGVEMTYGVADLFVAAPRSLELLRGEPRLVRLRAPGGGEGASLWLLPRDAHARVEFAPRAPRWPSSPLEIRIKIQDARGAGVPEWIEAHPKVTVGVDPVEVEFSRKGDWITGVLPARAGKGPWVVRVEVEDQHGIELGRDFIEIAGSSAQKRAGKQGS